LNIINGNTSISGWVYAFTVRKKGPLQGAGLLDYQLFHAFFEGSRRGYRVEISAIFPKYSLYQQDREQVMVGKERQV
jgi:hypothetical protein